jgi:hypothetical protein
MPVSIDYSDIYTNSWCARNDFKIFAPHPWFHRQASSLCSKCPDDGNTQLERPAVINKTWPRIGNHVVCVSHDLLCNPTHVYFSDLIFDLSVIRDHTWFDLRRGRSDTYRDRRACDQWHADYLARYYGPFRVFQLLYFRDKHFTFYVIYLCHVCLTGMDKTPVNNGFIQILLHWKQVDTSSSETNKLPLTNYIEQSAFWHSGSIEANKKKPCYVFVIKGLGTSYGNSAILNMPKLKTVLHLMKVTDILVRHVSLLLLLITLSRH